MAIVAKYVFAFENNIFPWDRIDFYSLEKKTHSLTNVKYIVLIMSDRNFPLFSPNKIFKSAAMNETKT